MKKIIFRTFICSFAISTLVIYSINRTETIFPRKINNITDNEKEIKAPYKGIASFVKAQPKNLDPIPSSQSDSLADNPESYIADFDTAYTESSYDDEIYDEPIEISFESNDTPIYSGDIETSFFNDSIDAPSEFSQEVIIADNSILSGLGDEDIVDAFSQVPAEDHAFAEAENKNQWIVSGLETDDNEQKILIPVQKENSGINKKTIIADNAAANELAMTDSGSTLKGMPAEIFEKSSPANTGEQENDSPWVVAKGSKFANNSFMISTAETENAKIETTLDISPKSKEGEVKVADMVRNILIPIPEDILKEGNVMPQLISSKRNKELQEKIEENIRKRKAEEEMLAAKDDDANQTIAEKDNIEEDADSEKKDKKTIFESISSIFSGSKPTPEVGVSKTGERNYDTANTVFTVKKSAKTKKENKVTKILPTEIKLSFQPNRAEISGVTLKWIEAFAKKTIEDEAVYLEVRIDGTSSFELQQKRLTLLHNILTNKGVDYKKINTVFTTREPNSFIIRTVKMSDKSAVSEGSQRTTDVNSKYYQNW